MTHELARIGFVAVGLAVLVFGAACVGWPSCAGEPPEPLGLALIAGAWLVYAELLDDEE